MIEYLTETHQLPYYVILWFVVTIFVLLCLLIQSMLKTRSLQRRQGEPQRTQSRATGRESPVSD